MSLTGGSTTASAETISGTDSGTTLISSSAISPFSTGRRGSKYGSAFFSSGLSEGSAFGNRGFSLTLSLI